MQVRPVRQTRCVRAPVSTRVRCAAGVVVVDLEEQTVHQREDEQVAAERHEAGQPRVPQGAVREHAQPAVVEHEGLQEASPAPRTRTVPRTGAVLGPRV